MNKHPFLIITFITAFFFIGWLKLGYQEYQHIKNEMAFNHCIENASNSMAKGICNFEYGIDY